MILLLSYLCENLPNVIYKTLHRTWDLVWPPPLLHFVAEVYSCCIQSPLLVYYSSCAVRVRVGLNESYQESCHVILRMSMRVRRTSMFLLRMWMHALNINDLCHERIRTPCQASATQRARSTNWYTRYPKIRTQYWHGHIPCSRIYLKTRQLLKGWYGIQRSLLKM